MTAFAPLMLAVALAATGPLTLEHEGSLKTVLQQIAKKGGLDVVIVGDLPQPAQVHLTGVTAEEALTAVAKIYQLDVQREGKLWVVRALDAKAVAPVASLTPGDPMSAEAKAQADAIEAQARVHADELQADAKERAEELKADAKERAEELKAELKERAEEAKEQAAEVKAELQDIKARAHDIKARIKHGSGNDRVVTGKDLIIDEGDHVESAVAYGGNVIVQSGASVDGDAVSFGGDVVLKDGASVDGDVVSFGGSIQKGEGAHIGGEQVSFGGDGVGASLTRGVVRAKDHAERGPGGFGSSLATFILQFALLFGLGFILKLFMPERTKRLEAALRERPVANGFVGFLGLLATIPLTVALAVTVVGIPLIVVLWMGVALAVAVAGVMVANQLGLWIPIGRTQKTQALVLAVGILAVLVLVRIPVVGPMAVTLAMLAALGAMVRTRFGQSPRGTPMPDSLGSSQIPA